MLTIFLLLTTLTLFQESVKDRASQNRMKLQQEQKPRRKPCRGFEREEIGRIVRKSVQGLGFSYPEPVSWPLFEFWNPMTWLNPRFSSETMFHLLRGSKVSNNQMYQQLKKSLLPSRLFFGNIRAELGVWNIEKKTKNKKPGEGTSTKNTNKNVKNKNKKD